MKNSDPGSRISDKHPGSATLRQTDLKTIIGEGRAVSKGPLNNLAIFFLFPSKQFLPTSLKIQLLIILCNICYEC
jgi:hypothetical protein